jgi:UDP-glucose 4-epimerase
MAVYGDARYLPIKEDHLTEPISPYGIAKLASERYCLQVAKQHGFKVTVLRYFNTFGPRQTFTPYVGVITIFINLALRHQAPVIFGNGEQRRDFVHVEDVADANILAMKSDVGSGIFNIGSGKGTSVAEVARMVLERIDPEMRPNHGPKQPGEPTDSIGDISRATDVLKFRPKWTLEDKLDELINWWKNQPRDSLMTARVEAFLDSVRGRCEVR